MYIHTHPHPHMPVRTSNGDVFGAWNLLLWRPNKISNIFYHIQTYHGKCRFIEKYWYLRFCTLVLLWNGKTHCFSFQVLKTKFHWKTTAFKGNFPANYICEGRIVKSGCFWSWFDEISNEVDFDLFSLSLILLHVYQRDLIIIIIS